MNNIKPWFEKEIRTTIEKIQQVRSEGDLCFALLSDSMLYDTGVDTRDNIRAVDDGVGFDFVMHLGNITTGKNPEKISRKLFREELDAYRTSISAKKLLVAQGDCDGYRDENFCGQLVLSIVRDNMWHEDTAFIDQYENAHRIGDAPYYYVDFPQQQVRVVVLCSYQHEFDGEHRLFEKRTSYGLKQLAWLQDEALQAQKGWHVLIFSHAIPESRFETGKDPFIYKGFSTEKTLSLLQKAITNHGISIAGVIAGRYHYDAQALIGGIQHVTVDQQYPQVSPAPTVEGAVTADSRTLGTAEQDLWDACVLKPNERKMYLFRFGAGEDRVICY